jgi:chromate reductase, NAD(P)H dehydrogenase (quinone)
VTRDSVRALALVGSLRARSYNRALAEAMRGLGAGYIELEIVEGLASLASFCEDVEPLPAVTALKDRVRAADALVVVSPEYNYGVPGGLKNVLDWLSHPPTDTPLRGKPVGLAGVSTGRFGTVRCQLALRQVFLYTGSPVLPRPEVMLTASDGLFDPDTLAITDEPTRQLLRAFLLSLAAWARRMAPARQAGPAGAR